VSEAMSRRWASDIEEAFKPKRDWNNKLRKHIELETEAVEDLKRLLLERFPAIHIEAYLEEKVKQHTQAIHGLLIKRLSKRSGGDPYSFVAVLTEIHGIVASKFGMFSTSQRERAEAEHNPAFRHLTTPPEGGVTLLQRGTPGTATKADRSRLWTAVAQPYSFPPQQDDVIVIDDDEAPVGPYHPSVLGYAPRPQTYAGMFKKP
jgi:hypothetical protein